MIDQLVLSHHNTSTFFPPHIDKYFTIEENASLPITLPLTSSDSELSPARNSNSLFFKHFIVPSIIISKFSFSIIILIQFLPRTFQNTVTHGDTLTSLFHLTNVRLDVKNLSQHQNAYLQQPPRFLLLLIRTNMSYLYQSPLNSPAMP